MTISFSNLFTTKEFIGTLSSNLSELYLLLDQNGMICDCIGDLSLILSNPTSILGRNISELFSEGVKLMLKNILKQTFSSNKSQSIEVSVNFEKRMKILDCKFIYSNDTSVLMIIRDITEHKIIKLKLDEFKYSYQDFIENLDGIAYQGYEDFSAAFFHGSIKEITGYTESEFLDGTIKWDSIIHPEDIDRVNESVEEFNKSDLTSSSREYRIIRKDGETRWVITRYKKFYDKQTKKKGTRGLIYDITERKKAEKELKKSEETYRNLINNINDIIIEMDLKGYFTYISPQVYDITGYKPNDVIGKSGFDFIHQDDLMSAGKALRKGLNRREKIYLEYRIKKKNGKYIYVSGTGRVVNTGGEDKIVALIRDISKEKKIEKEIKESEERFKTLFEVAPASIVVSDIESKITMCNNKFLTLHGFNKPEEVIGRKISDFISKQDKPKINSSISKTLGEIPRGIKQYKMIRKDGSEFEAEGNSAPIKDKNGKVVELIGIAQDITERKIAERKLQESESKYRNLFDNAPFAIMILNKKGFIKDCNNTSLKLTGFRKEELIGKSFLDFDFYEGEETEIISNRISLVSEGELLPSRELQLMKKDGSAFWASSNLNFIQLGDEQHILAFFQDISDKKKAQDKLKESEQSFRSLFEQAAVGIATISIDGRFLRVNQKFCEILKYSQEEMITNNIREIAFHSELIEGDDYLERMLLGEINPLTIQKQYLCKDGSVVWLNLTLKLIFNSYGFPIYFISVAEDITELKEAERKLKESEARFHKIFDEGPMGMILVNMDQTFMSVNKAFCELLGYSRGEVLKSTIKDFVHPDDLQRDLEGIMKVLNGESPIYKKESRYIKKNGDLLWGSVVTSFIRDKAGTPLYGVAIIEDITAQKQAKIKIKESEEKYRTLFDNAPFGIALFNLEGVIVDCNRELESITGYNSEELHNKNFLDFSLYVQPKDQNYQERKELLDRGISPLEREVHLFKKDGSQFWAKTQINRIQLTDGLYIQAIIQDITNQKVAEEKLKDSEEKYRLLVENAQEGIWAIDADSETTYSNERMADMLGYSPEEMLGKHLFDFLDEQSVNNAKKKLKLREQGVKDKYLRNFIRKDGKKIITSLETAPILGKEGTYLGAIACVIDITERIRAEEKLKESEEKFRTITEKSLMGIAILQDEEFKYMNHQHAIIHGYDVDELTFKPNKYIDLIHPDDRDFVIDQAKKKQKGRGDVVNEYQYRGLKKSGEMIWIEILSKTINYNGKPANLISLIDITEKKLIEERLVESEEKFRILAENIPGVIYLCKNDDRWTMLYLNDEVEKLTGYPKQYFLSDQLSFVDLYHPEEVSQIYKDVEKALINNSSFELTYRIKHRNGQWRWVNEIGIGIYKNEEVELLEGFLIDITERKKAIERLQESEEKFRSIAEQSIAGISIVQNNKFKYINDAFVRISGYSLEEINSTEVNQFYSKVVVPESQEYVLAHSQVTQSGKRSTPDMYEVKVFSKNGKEKWILTYNKSIIFEAKPAAMNVLIDITERKDIEEKLKESEEKFRNIAEQNLMGIGILQDNKVKYVNQGIANIYGYTIEEMLDWDTFDVTKHVTAESMKVVKEQNKLLAKGESIHFPMQTIKKSGEKVWVDHISKIINYNGRPAELMTQVEITERMNLQQELIKLNNLKSELLRRTSHELKTPLVSIKGFTQLLLSKYGSSMNQDMMSMILLIKDGCNRLQNLIQDILDASKLESGKSSLNKTLENLSFLIRYTIDSLKPLLDFRKQTLNLDIQDDLITTFEKEKLYEVLANLLNNAIKYTPPGGRIKVKTEIEGGVIKVSVEDNGIGITEEEKEQIFTQFGKIERYGQGWDLESEGSGLGLYICKKIIELHDGKIWVESEGRNKGSTFYFTLPIIKE